LLTAAAWLDNGLALMFFSVAVSRPVVSVVHRSLWDKLDTRGGLDPPRTQTPHLSVLNSGARTTSGVETLEVISPELALVDPELATRARAALRISDGDELVDAEQPAPYADEIPPAPSDDEETVLSPELALVDPELAERARAQLADGEPASPAAPVRQPEQPPQPLRPSRVPPRAERAEPVDPTRRARYKGSLIAAVIVLAAGLGAAAAIWARYDDGASGSGGMTQAPFQPLRERSLATATTERGETTTATPSKQGVAGQKDGRPARRSRRKGIAPGPRSDVRTQTLGRPRPAAFHVPGAPKEPLDEIPLPARARRLEAWLTRGRGPTAANQRHWLYQHAWIVTGARFGWWHGAEAIRILIRVDRRVESQWGVGYRSEAAARFALAAVEARAK
jgi:hypothetical protein